MKTIRLRNRIMLALIYMLAFWGVCIALYGYFVVKTYIVGEAQDKVRSDLNTVRAVYQENLKLMKASMDLIHPDDDIPALRDQLGLDYLLLAQSNEPRIQSEIVAQVFADGQALGATRIISAEELAQMNQARSIDVRPTPKARPSDKKNLASALSLEYARPFADGTGRVRAVLYGGKIINKNNALIDNIVNAVFEKKIYEGKPEGTVTVFQDDIRVSTNVLDRQGQRALGTRVSEEVYHSVVENGQAWYDRAFVVTDWYLTAYEPLRDIHERIIGILYVGILEKPFADIQRRMFLSLLMIFLITAVPTGVFAFWIAGSVTRPLTEMVARTARIAEGDWHNKIEARSSVREIDRLTHSFNDMQQKLAEREGRLAVTNDKLAVLNKRYLDLIGFVSHELKGILSSIVLNTYLLRKQILGPVNEKQHTALLSMSRNLDYLAVTVKNFLNLSRIEKDEMVVEKQELLVKEHLFDPAIEAFTLPAEEKEMRLVCEIDPALRIFADPGLMQIVVNNLLSNAIKYGQQKGEIRISARQSDSQVEVSVYNDGEPIAAVDVGKLFKKFSRVVYRGMEKIKGTGIGLFITKEIIERHGGTIWVEPSERGNTFRFRLAQS